MIPSEILEFRKGSTIVHRFTPYTKMLYAILFSILALLKPELNYTLFIFVLTIIPIILARMIILWLKSLKGLIILIIMVFGFNMLFTMNTYYSLSMVFRLLALVNIFMVFLRTTSPEDLAYALYKLGLPYDFVLAFTMALRFIPTMFKDIQAVIDAQRARGLETEKGSPLKRARNYIPIFIPLIVNAIRRARSVAETMESRAFGATKKPTSLYEVKLKTLDYMGMIVIIATTLLMFYIVYILNINIL
ncbi:MAG: energy-coupling factor transporter transmembrane component T family protein [Thermoprotei archaeon]|jgi:energy-coupling factor transport system permease protein